VPRFVYAHIHSPIACLHEKMACEMDEAGLLNSMTDEGLAETCKRLQRSCNDMAMLLQELEQEQDMLHRDQDRMHQRIRKLTPQADKSKSEWSMIWNMFSDVDKKLEVSKIIQAKEERQASKRRRWSSPSQTPTKNSEENDDEKDHGPFSDANMKLSWGRDVTLGALRQASSKGLDAVALGCWIHAALLAEPVAEAEALPESAELWAAQVAAAASVAVQVHSSFPGLSPANSSRQPFDSPRASVRRPSKLETQAVAGSEAGAGAILSWVADWASRPGVGLAEVPYRGEALGVRVQQLTVVLQRTSTEQKWGLRWVREGFFQNKERIVDLVAPDSVAALWNQQQVELGEKDRCICPQDHLTSVNGKTGKDEMTAELGGREVVLEFHRFVKDMQQPRPADPGGQLLDPQSAGPTATANSGFHPPARGAFHTAFSAYLQNVSPALKQEEEKAPARTSGAQSAEGAHVPDSDDCKPETRESSNLSQRDTEAPGLANETSHSSQSTSSSVALAKDIVPSKVPHSLIVQVLSLGTGSIRLSWLFDWDAVSEDLAHCGNGSRCFEVVQRCDGKEEGEVRHFSARASMNLQLPTGHRYTFEVRAALTDASSGIGSSAANPQLIWVSQPSLSATADVRDNAGVSAQPMPDAMSSSAVMVQPCSPSKGGVASRLGCFLAKKPMMGQSGTTSAPSSSMSSSAPVERPTPSTVNSECVSHLRTSVNPLTTAKPRVVTVGLLNPEAEKRDIADRLQIRRGGPSGPKSEAQQDFEIQRTDNTDADDAGELQRLMHALGTLEKTQASKLKTDTGEFIAEEGSHDLKQRLEPGMDEIGPCETGWASFESPWLPPERCDKDAVPEQHDSCDTTQATNALQVEKCTHTLRVQLADGKVAVLDFREKDDLHASVHTFVVNSGIRDILEQPLLDRATVMMESGRSEDQVDIIDLIDAM